MKLEAKRITPEQIAAAQAVFDAGERSPSRIAQAAGVTRKTAREMLRRVGIKIEPREQLPDYWREKFARWK